MARKIIQSVESGQIVKTFSDLADTILIQHAASNGLKRNTHVVFGADIHLTSAIFAQTVLVDRLQPMSNIVLTFQQPEKKFPYQFAASAQKKPRQFAIETSPLKNELNGGPQSMLLGYSLLNGARAAFVDIKTLDPQAGLPIDANITVSTPNATIDVEYLSQHQKRYIDGYFNSISKEEFAELTQHWLNVEGEGLAIKSVAGHNLRADYMRRGITHDVEKDSATLHVHVGTPDFTVLNSDDDFFNRKKMHNLPRLLNRADPGANVLVINCVSNTPASRLTAVQDFTLARREILHFDMPVYPAWARRQSESLPRTVTEQGYWNWLAWENKALKYEY